MGSLFERPKSPPVVQQTIPTVQVEDTDVGNGMLLRERIKRSDRSKGRRIY